MLNRTRTKFPESERESKIADLDYEIVEVVRRTGLTESRIKGLKAEGTESWDRLQDRIRAQEESIGIKEKHSRQKAIQDPVHGAILLEPWELDIISSREMLRLRYVMQLGPAHIVYPGATHSRFLHCLGTNFLAQKCIRVVNYCEDLENPHFIPLSDLLETYHERLFRAVALLHDVGHPPTSHTIEFALSCWAGLTHTDLGEYLILHTSLSELLEETGIDSKDVANILKRRTNDSILNLISDFIDSPLDIDKTDYLIRDAHFSGVQLGLFPAERVLLTNRVVRTSNDGFVRAFMLKALHSLEALILSRNWMFSDLYLHHAVRVAEALTSKATYFRMKEEKLSKNECVGLFTRMRDYDLYSWLEGSECDFVREYAARIRHRRLFKVITSRPLSSFVGEARTRFDDMQHDIETLIEAERELIDDVGKVIIDIVDPQLGEDLLGQIPLLVGSETSGLRLINMEQAEQGKPLIHALKQQKLTIPSVRVYSDPELGDQVRKEFNRIFPSNETAHAEDDYDLTDI